MSKKAIALVEEVVQGAYGVAEMNGINDMAPFHREQAAVLALHTYIAALHTRITCLHTANNMQADMLGRQSQLVSRWRNRAVALGYTTVVAGVNLDEPRRVAPDPEVDVGPGSSPVPDTYQGHAGTTGGLQQHSIGELYPCIIAKVGDVWQVDHSSLGFLANGFNTQAEAVAWAKNFKEQDR